MKIFQGVIGIDEATFSKNGMLNRRNIHFWCDQNPQHIARDIHFKTRNLMFYAAERRRILCLHLPNKNLNSVR